ncbi:lachesin-like isoform X2, partial [Vespula squamosa]
MSSTHGGCFESSPGQELRRKSWKMRKRDGRAGKETATECQIVHQNSDEIGIELRIEISDCLTENGIKFYSLLYLRREGQKKKVLLSLNEEKRYSFTSCNIVTVTIGLFLPSVTTARDPEFVSEIGNITVPAGRNVKMACSVKDLGTFKKDERPKLILQDILFTNFLHLTIKMDIESETCYNSLVIVEYFYLRGEISKTNGRTGTDRWEDGVGGRRGGWLRVVCSSSTKLLGRNKLDVVKFTTANETNAKVNNSITRGVPLRSTFSLELSVVNRSSVSVDRRVIGSDISGCYALRAAVGYNEDARFQELQSEEETHSVLSLLRSTDSKTANTRLGAAKPQTRANTMAASGITSTRCVKERYVNSSKKLKKVGRSYPFEEI